MAHHALVPDRILCSPARRTRDTWTALSAAMAAEPPAAADVVFDVRLYSASRQSLMSIIRSQNGAVRKLLVLGHNPGLQEAAEMLIAAGDVEQREKLREKFPTAALAVIDFTFDAWSQIHDHSGRLDRFVTPRMIAAAAKV